MIKQLSYLTLFILLVSACKKDETTSLQWSELAKEKREAIEQLIASEKCENLNDWTIEKVANYWCGHSYFPVHKRTKTQFEKLWNEYRELESKGIDAGIREGIIYEPCEEVIWHVSAPIQLICENAKAKLLYMKDLSLADSKAQIIPVKTKIDNYLNNLKCNGKDNWTTTILLRDCGFDYIPYLTTANLTEIKKDIALYNSLKKNILEAEKPNCPVGEYMYPTGVKCVNNKPVVELSK
ncbi:hypothetical protein [Sphingobacterium faecium]